MISRPMPAGNGQNRDGHMARAKGVDEKAFEGEAVRKGLE
jgi:hypothetical protein